MIPGQGTRILHAAQYGQKKPRKSFLGVQRLRFAASTAGVKGLTPGQGTRILHATWHGQKVKVVIIITSL